MKRISATACVVGGGPAGLVLGLLLSRAGVDTIVLEKHGGSRCSLASPRASSASASGPSG